MKSQTLRSKTILAIDNGTQSVRALLFDMQGNLLAKGKVEVEPYFSHHPGWAEQDVDVYWDALVRACQQLWDCSPVYSESLAAITLTTQRGTVVNVDEQGNALRPAIVWLDQRSNECYPSLPFIWRSLFKVAGVEDIIERFSRNAESVWIAQNQADIWQKTHKFLLLSGYLTFRLTGSFRDSIGAQVGYIPFDYKGLKWAPKHDWRFSLFGKNMRDCLPELVEPGQSLGTVREEVAQELGIPAGLPLLAAASDKACEVLGSGVTDPSMASLSYGTTATINTANTRYVEPIRFLPAYPSAIPRQYVSEVMIYRGFWMVSWFKKEFGLKEQRIAHERGIPPETLFDELVNEVPPGSMGLMLQPYWSPGVRDPGPEAKGSVIGFGDVHTRSHFYRAILEGLAYGLREGKERLEKRNGQRVKVLRVAGGGSQSDAAMQLTADIFGLAAERPHTYETSGLGAAIDAAVGLGVYPNFDEAVKNMTRVGRVFEPSYCAVETYDRLYREVYLKMYKQLQPLYRSIRDITGYPA